MRNDPVQLKGGLVVRDPRLDRVPFHDPKSRDWQARPLLDQLREAKGRSPARRPAKPTLDQGSEGACVGFSIATLMNASPTRRKPPWTAAEALWLYDNARREDEWPGDTHSGTSLVAALRVAKRHGIVGDYRWLGAGSGTLDQDVVDTLELKGGFVAGIPVYDSMFDTDVHGVLTVDPDSGLAGYHAIAVLDLRAGALPGRRKAQDHVVLQNSWGAPWGAAWYGEGGHAYVALDDLLTKLLPAEVWGEAVTWVEVEHGPGWQGATG